MQQLQLLWEQKKQNRLLILPELVVLRAQVSQELQYLRELKK
jgi:hypothetical protein